MKLQAGMAFECELDSISVKGRIVENSGKFALRYKNAWGVDEFFSLDLLRLGVGVNKVSSIVSIIPTFKIIPITLNLLQVGDIIAIHIDQYKKVLGRLNDIIFLSIINGHEITSSNPLTIHEMKNCKYTVIQPEWEEEKPCFFCGKLGQIIFKNIYICKECGGEIFNLYAST